MKALAKLSRATVLCLLMTACQSTGGNTPQYDMERLIAQATLMESLNMSIVGLARNIPNVDITGWNELDESNLLLHKLSDEEFFLVTFIVPCEPLKRALTIHFEAWGVTLNAGDYVIVVTSPSGPEARCKIQEIYDLVPRR